MAGVGGGLLLIVLVGHGCTESTKLGICIRDIILDCYIVHALHRLVLKTSVNQCFFAFCPIFV